MTLPYIPTVLILGALFGLVGGGMIFRITRNWRAAGIVVGAVSITALLWLLRGVLE